MIKSESNPDFVNAFLDHSITILNKSANSVKEYNYDLMTFLRFIKMHFKMTKETELKNIEINDITIDIIKKITLNDIYAFLAYLTKEYKNKSNTRARKVSTLRIFFKYLTRKAELLNVDPTQDLETPKLDKRLPKYLSLDDSKKLLDITSNEDNRNSERDFAIITLFLNCGMRLSELVSINIEDIDFNECKLSVLGKGKKERTIYLNKSCMKAIADYIEVRPKNGIKDDSKHSKKALFLSERKARISNRTVESVVSKQLQAAGLSTKKYSVHKLRHTAATLMYQYGQVDIRALQELLGHESIATTEIYTHVSNEQVRDAVDRNPLNDI